MNPPKKIVSKKRPKWSKVFVDRIESQHYDDVVAQKKLNNSWLVLCAGSTIRHRMINNIKNKMSSKSFSCVRTVENYNSAPSPHSEFEPCWNGHNFLCLLCAKPAVNGLIPCKTCNTYVHKLCRDEDLIKNNEMQKDFESLDCDFNNSFIDDGNDSKFDEENTRNDNINFRISNTPLDCGVSSFAYNEDDQYTCYLCLETSKSDLEYYEKHRIDLNKKRIKLIWGKYLVRFFKSKIVRKRFVLKRWMVIKIQSYARKRIQKTKFAIFCRHQLRILILEITHLPPFTISKGGLIIVTVVDPIRRAQLYRFDKNYEESLQEGILIPGISANMLVTISFCLPKEDILGVFNSYKVICQSLLSIRDIEDYLVKKILNVTFIKQIRYMPQELKGETNTHLYSATANDYLVENYDIDKILSSSSGDGDLNTSVKVSYNPSNPMSSLCSFVNAPSLEFLRKRIEKKGIHEKQEHQRTSQWWFILNELSLYFYQYYGIFIYSFIYLFIYLSIFIYTH
jgi:hypothetical protein